MMFKNKTLYSLIASFLALIGFFFPFLSAFGVGAGSGFSCAFAFGNFGCILVLFALLATIGGIVLSFLKKAKLVPIVYFAGAAFCLLSVFFIGAGTYGMAGAGFGQWWCLIFLAAAGVFEMFGDSFLPILPIAGVNADMGGAAHHTTYTASTASATFCPSCGAKIEADAKFCPSCGAKR